MKHAASRAMFEHWNERRGTRFAPERGEIEPGRIRKILADSIILAVDPQAGHPFRLAGTRVCALLCRELKGEPFIELWAQASRSLVRELVAIATHEAVGVVASACARTADDPPLDLELLLLPLYHRGSLNERLLGVLAPIVIPYWLGIRPIDGMEIGAFRHIAPATETIAAPRLVPARDTRGRDRFVVYEGGGRKPLNSGAIHIEPDN